MPSEKNLYSKTARLYDIIYGSKQSWPDIPFYREYAKQQRGDVLELGCGTGRVALALAKDGYHITDLDLSQHMLEIFRGKLTPEISGHVDIIHGNMADFSIGDPPRKFALITAPDRAFLALTSQADIENALSCIYKHLADDGLFIVNVFNPYANPMNESWCKAEEFIDEITDEESGIRIKRYECREKIDTANQIIYPYLAYEIIYQDGHTERLIEPLQLKYYYSHQLRAEVEKAGFVVADEFSCYKKSPPGGREIILVCKRKLSD